MTIVQTARDLVSEYNICMMDNMGRKEPSKAMIEPTKALIEFYTNTIEANRRGWSFATWHECYKSYYYDERNLAITKDGKLRQIADQLFALDLKEYFKEVVGEEDRDVETLALIRRDMDERLDHLLEL